MNKKIGIIGGGPGGLLLGLLLQQKGYEFKIFEKEKSDINRVKGGSLDIHDDSGQIALKKAGLLDIFRQQARFEGEDFKLVNKYGVELISETAEDEGTRPEIDRGDLCDLIKNQINPDNIYYGYEFQKLETKDGMTDVYFKNGEVRSFDLVVGSDGAFSKVRKYLTEEDILYSGISMVELRISDVMNQYPELYEYNQRGKVFVLDDNKGILAQLNGDGSIKVYATFKIDYEALENFKSLSSDKVKKHIKSQFEGWSKQIMKYIDYADDHFLYRRIYMLPVGFTWSHQKNITLIGDSAHLMSPFAGEGVNMALYDAYCLFNEIENNDDLGRAIENYEQKMYEYSRDSAAESFENLQLMFGEDAPNKLASLMNSYKQENN